MCLGTANGVKAPTKIWSERMTPQEALELLNNMEFKHEYQGKDEYGDMLMWCKTALKKQIPKKPIVKTTKSYWGDDIDEVYLCPECTMSICDAQSLDFCKDDYTHCHCGQAIDWGDIK